MGRAVLLLLQQPFSLESQFLHDPFCFGVGCMLCGIIVSHASKLVQKNMLKRLKGLANMPLSMVMTGDNLSLNKLV